MELNELQTQEIQIVAKIIAGWGYLKKYHNKILDYPKLRFPKTNKLLLHVCEQLSDMAFDGNDNNILSIVISYMRSSPEAWPNEVRSTLIQSLLSEIASVKETISKYEPPYNEYALKNQTLNALDEYLKNSYKARKAELLTGIASQTDNLDDAALYLEELYQAFSVDLEAGVDSFKELLEAGRVPTQTEVVKTPFKQLNNAINEGGLVSGRTTVIIASQGTGKTSISIQMAIHAVRDGKDVIIFSFEMKKESLMWRILSEATETPVRELYKMRESGYFTKEIIDAAKKLDKHITIEYPGEKADLLFVKSQISSYIQANNKPPALVIIDYIQQLTSGARNVFTNSRHGDLNEVSRMLHHYSHLYNTHIIILSQRSEDYSYGGRAIEHPPDLVLILQKNEEPNSAELVVKKNRHGKGNITIPLTWYGDITTFTEANTFDNDLGRRVNEALFGRNESPSNNENEYDIPF